MAFISFFRLRSAIVFLLLLITQVTAHLHLSSDELVDYHRQIKRDSEALSKCLKSPAMQEHNARMLTYRNETLHKLRIARGIDPHIDLPKRGGDEDRALWASINHESAPSHSQDPQDISNFRWNERLHQYKGVALTKQSIYGPYWKERQPLRQDIRAGECGVYLRLAMQVIDIKTCLPMQGAQVDIWHANAAGDYSLVMGGYLRGWQRTSAQGTVDFDTNFPGHYYGRTTHLHLTVRVPGSRRYVNAGQIYFYQTIVDAVNAADRYKGNPNVVVPNLKDGLMAFHDVFETYDPFVHWSRIGRSLEDGGLLCWITLGVDPSNMDVHQPLDKVGTRDVVDFHLA